MSHSFFWGGTLSSLRRPLGRKLGLKSWCFNLALCAHLWLRGLGVAQSRPLPRVALASACPGEASSFCLLSGKALLDHLTDEDTESQSGPVICQMSPQL